MLIGCGRDPQPGDAARDAMDAVRSDRSAPDAVDAMQPVDAQSPFDALDVPGDTRPPAPRTFDLDRDGSPETDLHVAVCPADAARLCVIAVTDARTWAIALPTGATIAGTSLVTGPALRAIGDHLGAAHSEVSVLFRIAASGHDRPALAIVDVQGETLGPWVAAPDIAGFADNYPLASFTDFVRAPDGRLHPFLAPGYGDSDRIAWGWACGFHAGATGGTHCPAGFLESSTVPPGVTGWFREVGGYMQDLDADGWEDINLIYHQRIVSFSGQTGAHLVTTTYDVAAADEPSSPPLFHSGRNYGTHASFTGADGRLRNVIVGGSPVGSFADYNCNVSRFVAVLESTAGSPASRVMRWSDYFGFASSIFVHYDAAYESNPASDLARLGDFENGCIHRFGDSRTTIDGQDAVMFDYFAADAPVDPCLVEQYRLYVGPYDMAEWDAWYACFGRNIAQTGIWGMQARRVSDGSSITGSQGTYVWAQTDRMLPSGEIVYLVESVPMHSRFDLAGVAPTRLAVSALVSGLWAARGTFPVAGRPRIASIPAEGPTGVGSFTPLAVLTTDDRDHDGLADVQLDDGTWIGWNATTRAFVVK